MRKQSEAPSLLTPAPAYCIATNQRAPGPSIRFGGFSCQIQEMRDMENVARWQDWAPCSGYIRSRSRAPGAPRLSQWWGERLVEVNGDGRLAWAYHR